MWEGLIDYGSLERQHTCSKANSSAPWGWKANSGNLRSGVGVATMPFVCPMGGGWDGVMNHLLVALFWW
jgi:hypothetical protein